MKTIQALTVTSIVLFMILLATPSVDASRASRVMLSELTANETCVIDDQSSYDLGTPTVYYSSGSTSVAMHSSGVYNVSVSGSATSIQIAGQSVPSQGIGYVALSATDSVKVQWTGTNAITITNVNEN